MLEEGWREKSYSEVARGSQASQNIQLATWTLLKFWVKFDTEITNRAFTVLEGNKFGERKREEIIEENMSTADGGNFTDSSATVEHQVIKHQSGAKRSEAKRS